MTSHSEHSGFVRGYASELIEDEFADTGAVRDAVANNLTHLLDESTQHLVNVVLATGEFYQQSSPSTSLFQRIDGLGDFKFPLRIQPSTGNSVRVAVYLRGYTSSAGTITFRVALTFGAAEPGEPYTDADTYNISEGSTTSTSATDITLSPQPIYLPAGVIAARERGHGDTRMRFSSLMGDGSVGAGEVLWARLSVWAKTSQASAKPTVVALMAREFTGE